MWEQISGANHIFVELIEKHKEEVSIWRLCFMVSQGRKDTPRQIF
jgi:hypothetical protein